MKIVVIGGSGLIGQKLVTRLHERGQEAVAAFPASGVNAVTGAGLADVLVDAEVVVDVTNAPSFEDAAVVECFEKSSWTLLAAEADAGMGHHVAVSIVGADRIPDSGYMRAKVAQETLIQSAGIPYRFQGLTALELPQDALEHRTKRLGGDRVKDCTHVRVAGNPLNAIDGVQIALRVLLVKGE